MNKELFDLLMDQMDREMAAGRKARDLEMELAVSRHDSEVLVLPASLVMSARAQYQFFRKQVTGYLSMMAVAAEKEGGPVGIFQKLRELTDTELVLDEMFEVIPDV